MRDDDAVKVNIIAAIKKLQKQYLGNYTTTDPEFVAFGGQALFNMMESSDTIEKGFYENLCVVTDG